jgi:hemoglobin
MNIRSASFGFALAASLFLCAAPNASAQQAPSATSLYKQLGGYDAIAAVSDDFINRIATNPKLTKFFVGVSDAHKGEIRQRVVDFICSKTGGPCVYTGQDMKTSHAGLHITEDEWNAAVADFGETAKKFTIPPNLQQQIGALFTQLKADIVQAR